MRLGAISLPASTAVKIISEDAASFTVGGYGVVFGGVDLVGDSFSKETDFWFDRITETPMILFHHGKDDTLKRLVVGHVTKKKLDDIGLWIEAQIDNAKQYAAAIRELVGKDFIGWSSGAVPHLVERTTDKKILSWPIAEFSLTPTPAEPRTLGVRELKALSDYEPALKLLAALAEKATPPADTPPAPTPTETKALSYEDIRDRISTLLNPVQPLGIGSNTYTYVLQTFPDYCIARSHGPDGEMKWRVPYTIGDDGAITLGMAVEVEEVYVPVTTKAHDIAAKMIALSIVATTLGSETKAGRRMAGVMAARLKAIREAVDEIENWANYTDKQAAADDGKVIDFDSYVYELALN